MNSEKLNKQQSMNWSKIINKLGTKIILNNQTFCTEALGISVVD